MLMIFFLSVPKNREKKPEPKPRVTDLLIVKTPDIQTLFQFPSEPEENARN